MKKIHWLMGVGFVVILIGAMVSATQFGEKSPLIASGTVTLNTESNGGQTLFITVLSSDSPMPVGAMKVAIDPSSPGLLYTFVLTKENLRVMNPDAPLPSRFKLKARLDLDGQGGMDQSGDIIGIVENVALGQENVTITLDQKVQ